MIDQVEDVQRLIGLEVELRDVLRFLKFNLSLIIFLSVECNFLLSFSCEKVVVNVFKSLKASWFLSFGIHYSMFSVVVITPVWCKVPKHPTEVKDPHKTKRTSTSILSFFEKVISEYIKNLEVIINKSIRKNHHMTIQDT